MRNSAVVFEDHTTPDQYIACKPGAPQARGVEDIARRRTVGRDERGHDLR
jgi:hypothetical protein